MNNAIRLTDFCKNSVAMDKPELSAVLRRTSFAVSQIFVHFFLLPFKRIKIVNKITATLGNVLVRHREEGESRNK